MKSPQSEQMRIEWVNVYTCVQSMLSMRTYIKLNHYAVIPFVSGRRWPFFVLYFSNVISILVPSKNPVLLLVVDDIYNVFYFKSQG